MKLLYKCINLCDNGVPIFKLMSPRTAAAVMFVPSFNFMHVTFVNSCQTRVFIILFLVLVYRTMF